MPSLDLNPCWANVFGRAAGAVGVTDTPQECSSEIWVLNLSSGLNLSFSPNLSVCACTKLLHLLGCVGNSLLLLEPLALQFSFLFIFPAYMLHICSLYVKTFLLVWRGQGLVLHFMLPICFCKTWTHWSNGSYSNMGQEIWILLNLLCRGERNRLKKK